jgi:GTP-binding protein
VVGVEDADIGDMFTCRIDPITMAPIHVEEPTMSVVFAANTSPLVGREGTIVGARQIKERLLKEAESNISMRIQETPAKDGMEVAGRGVLHLSVLMETMRREGYEFQVGRPQVILKHEGGSKLEPIEQAVVDVPSVHAGKVIEIFGSAGGEMVDMVQRDEHVHLEFRIPSRGVMGLRTRILNGTRGEATLFHHFSEYGPYRGDIGGRIAGSLIAMSTDNAAAYALDALQTRGKLFIAPGDTCYEGMIVGEHAKDNDLVVNVAKAKQLTNMRAASADKGIQLAPPVTFTLEEALEYIEDDELVEVTPESVRLRKRLLTENERKKASRR